MVTGHARMQTSEEFFTCRWTLDEETQESLLLVAGKLGVMRVINCHTCQAVWVSSSPLACQTAWMTALAFSQCLLVSKPAGQQ